VDTINEEDLDVENDAIIFYTQQKRLTATPAACYAVPPAIMYYRLNAPVIPHTVALNPFNQDWDVFTWPRVFKKDAFMPALATRILRNMNVSTTLANLRTKKDSWLKSVPIEFQSNHPAWVWAMAYAHLWKDNHRQRVQRRQRRSKKDRDLLIPLDDAKDLFFRKQGDFKRIRFEKGHRGNIPPNNGFISEVVPWVADNKTYFSRRILYHLRQRIVEMKNVALQTVAGVLGTTLEQSRGRLRLCSMCKLVVECPMISGYWLPPAQDAWMAIKEHRVGCCIAESDVFFIPLQVAPKNILTTVGFDNISNRSLLTVMGDPDEWYNNQKKRSRLPGKLQDLGDDVSKADTMDNAHMIAILNQKRKIRRRATTQQRRHRVKKKENDVLV
jgi:hypothetical protein